MTRTPLRAVAATTLLAFTGCASSTMLKSTPPGAKVYLDGEPVGTTPYQMTDQKIVGSATRVKLVHPGYEPLEAVVQRNENFEVGPCIGGVLVLFPFLWIMGYKPEHNYELTPVQGQKPPPAPAPAPAPAAPAAPAPAPAPAPRA